MKIHVDSLTTTAVAGVILSALIAIFTSQFVSSISFVGLAFDSNEYLDFAVPENVDSAAIACPSLVLADWNDPVSGIETFLSSKIKIAPAIQ